MEKMFFIAVFCLFPLFFGCRTTKRIVVSSETVGTQQADDALSELGNQQTESAVAAQKITDTSNELADSISEAVTELESGTGTEREFREIIQQIESRQSIDYNEPDKTDSTTPK